MSAYGHAWSRSFFFGMQPTVLEHCKRVTMPTPPIPHLPNGERPVVAGTINSRRNISRCDVDSPDNSTLTCMPGISPQPQSCACRLMGLSPSGKGQLTGRHGSSQSRRRHIGDRYAECRRRFRLRGLDERRRMGRCVDDLSIAVITLEARSTLGARPRSGHQAVPATTATRHLAGTAAS